MTESYIIVFDTLDYALGPVHSLWHAWQLLHKYLVMKGNDQKAIALCRDRRLDDNRDFTLPTIGRVRIVELRSEIQ